MGLVPGDLPSLALPLIPWPQSSTASIGQVGAGGGASGPRQSLHALETSLS